MYQLGFDRILNVIFDQIMTVLVKKFDSKWSKDSKLSLSVILTWN